MEFATAVDSRMAATIWCNTAKAAEQFEFARRLCLGQCESQEAESLDSRRSRLGSTSGSNRHGIGWYPTVRNESTVIHEALASLVFFA